ncbi:hypothetical protein T484DRAFT_1973068 [Baffinella frigidus]|nr:hypothetical protein T484DRAFT_1973068 [Cryptophyta sp. CCMP2293]
MSHRQQSPLAPCLPGHPSPRAPHCSISHFLARQGAPRRAALRAAQQVADRARPAQLLAPPGCLPPRLPPTPARPRAAAPARALAPSRCARPRLLARTPGTLACPSSCPRRPCPQPAPPPRAVGDVSRPPSAPSPADSEPHARAATSLPRTQRRNCHLLPPHPPATPPHAAVSRTPPSAGAQPPCRPAQEGAVAAPGSVIEARDISALGACPASRARSNPPAPQAPRPALRFLPPSFERTSRLLPVCGYPLSEVVKLSHAGQCSAPVLAPLAAERERCRTSRLG